jgi:NhaA family Na+:H+ antiporter
VLTPLVEFFRTEAAGGAVLVVAVVVALVWANVAPASYADAWRHRAWVNDGLMTLFFLVVGLEIKRELVSGELRDRRTAVLPAIAALGGMVVPALIYLAWNAGTPAARGWGIPMATDIAFAAGVLTLLGRRVPAPLRLFVLSLAIVDDIGAIVVIAIAYSHGISPWWLAAAAGTVGALVLVRRAGASLVVILPLAVALWYCVLESGVHATLAGVAVALLVPTRTRDGRHLAQRLEHVLHPVASFVVVPLFAVANAGVVVDAHALADAAGSRVAWGILTGLVVGKFVGVCGSVALATRRGAGRLPDGVDAHAFAGGAAATGIGFTVSLFIAEAAFPSGSANARAATLAVLVASTVAAALAVATVLSRRREPKARHRELTHT